MKSIARYIFEAGMLKRVKRSGWWAEKVETPESVAGPFVPDCDTRFHSCEDGGSG